MSSKKEIFYEICTKIQEVVGRDPGKRGITPLIRQNALAQAALNFINAPSIAVLTGFPCRVVSSPPSETDGPPGAMALAFAALQLGKSTCIVTDTCNFAPLQTCSSALGLGSISRAQFEEFAFDPQDKDTPAFHERLQSISAKYNHTIAIERSGMAADGSFRTMRGTVMDHLVAPLDLLLTVGTANDSTLQGTPSRTSTGIGDGGNEAGMGIVHALVKEIIPNGPLIGSVTPCDALVVAGVSNWGGWGLIAAVEAATRLGLAPFSMPTTFEGRPDTNQGQDRGSIPAFEKQFLLPTTEEANVVANALMESGVGDGISGQIDPPGSVDGMQHDVHLALLQELRQLLAHSFELQV